MHFLYTEYYYADPTLTNHGKGAFRILGQTYYGEMTWIAGHF